MQEHGPTPTGASAPDAVLTRAQLRERQARQAAGFRFPLEVTGGVAQVRIPNLADRAFMARLPQETQRLLARHLFEASQEARPTPKTPQEALAALTESLADQEALANAFCRVGFLRPRLVETEAELDASDPYCWLVTDVNIEDRIAFLELCLEGERRAAQRLAPFPGGPVDALQAQPAEQAATAAERAPAPAGSGVL